MIVWLWEAGDAKGVTDDEDAALDDAAARTADGQAARVERALVISGFRHLTSDYVRTGIGWEGRAAAGQLHWVPIHPPIAPVPAPAT